MSIIRRQSRLFLPSLLRLCSHDDSVDGAIFTDKSTGTDIVFSRWQATLWQLLEVDLDRFRAALVIEQHAIIGRIILGTLVHDLSIFVATCSKYRFENFIPVANVDIRVILGEKMMW